MGECLLVRRGGGAKTAGYCTLTVASKESGSVALPLRMDANGTFALIIHSSRTQSPDWSDSDPQLFVYVNGLRKSKVVDTAFFSTTPTATSVSIKNPQGFTFTYHIYVVKLSD